MSTRISEAGLRRVAESVAGITGASTLNDTSTQAIVKEDFDTNPVASGWQLGTGWSWSANKLLFTP